MDFEQIIIKTVKQSMQPKTKRHINFYNQMSWRGQQGHNDKVHN